MAEYVRAKLESIYSVIKTHADKVRFLMLTSVSKFSQLSIFSGLNNLTDLYEYDFYATLFGYTEQEREDSFYRAELKRGERASADDALEQIIRRDYVAPYAKPGRTLFQVGIVFDDKTHHVKDAKAQTLVIPVPED